MEEHQHPGQQQHSEHAGEQQVHTAPPAAEAQAGEAHAEHKEENVFSELIGEMKNSYEVPFEPWGAVHLPLFFIDGEGTHFFANEHAAEETGKYTIVEGKIARVDHEAIKLDLSLTRNLVFLLFGATILLLLATRAARKLVKNTVPKGFANALEAVIVFIREDIAKPNLHGKEEAFMPLLLTIFFIVLASNLTGNLPFGHAATSDISVTVGLALISFFVIQASSIRSMGLTAYLKHLTGGVHWALWPLMIPIEVLGMFIKPFALSIRLFANISGGHVVILSLIGLIFLFKSLAIAPVSILLGLFISGLELFVAFLQAYVFTLLTALFIGAGLHTHTEHAEEHH